MIPGFTKSVRISKMAWLAIIWCFVAAIFLALAPTGTTQEASVAIQAGGEAVPTLGFRQANLLTTQGSGVLLILAMPAFFCLAAVGMAFVTKSGTPLGIGAIILLGLCALGAASIGFFFVPAAAFLALAAGRTPADVSRRAAASEP